MDIDLTFYLRLRRVFIIWRCSEEDNYLRLLTCTEIFLRLLFLTKRVNYLLYLYF